MGRPLAWRHLARLHEMVTSASIAEVVVERGLLHSPLLERAAAADRAFDEEVQALARDRGWTLPETKPYQWRLLTASSDPRPRVLRIVDRDVFELSSMARETDDDDVESLAQQLLSERRTLARELELELPALTLPGAK